MMNFSKSIEIDVIQFKNRSVCRIRLFPTFNSKIKWLGSELTLREILWCSNHNQFLEQDQDGADEEQVSVSDGNLKTVETKFDDGTTSENQLKTTSDSGRDEKVCFYTHHMIFG